MNKLPQVCKNSSMVADHDAGRQLTGVVLSLGCCNISIGSQFEGGIVHSRCSSNGGFGGRASRWAAYRRARGTRLGGWSTTH
eukprot:scaffold21465_cov18-Tisochrysis_lutea.AAC.5